ncbi:MAG: PKD domain-containing protein, partial [Saprospiraceae bacterium]
CDTAGNLLFFSNGCGVMDAGFHYVPGAEHINAGLFQDYLCNEIGGGRRPDALLILPDYSGQSFHLLYTRSTDVPVLSSDRLLWTKIKQDTVGDLLAEFVDSTLIEKPLFSGNLSACRHANGKDWWVVIPKNLVGVYYILQLGGGNYTIKTDSIGLATDDYDDSTGESVFSPDGSKYARYTIHADLQIFDFDRCTGDFSHPIHVPILDAADTTYAAGAAFSPSGRYLYVSSTKKIYQFDMQAADIPASKTTVAVYDGFFYPYPQVPTFFYQCELGPDGKIYVSVSGGQFAVHVIEHPDSAGLACQVIQHKYILDYPIAGGLPHFPNFRLGALSDSVCPPQMAPLADFSWQLADSLQPLQVQFVDHSLQDPQTWHWDFGDGTFSLDTNPVHTYALPGNYPVCLVVGNVVGVDTLCQWVPVMTSGVHETAIGRLRVWPNPVHTVLHLEMTGPQSVGKMYNLYGQVVLAETLTEGSNTWNVQSIPPGLYYLSVNNQVTCMLVITH